jgi:hypothetical protein
MFYSLVAAGPVAQRLEQGTHNPLVPGSNPGGPIFLDGLTVVEMRFRNFDFPAITNRNSCGRSNNPRNRAHPLSAKRV